MVMIVGTCKLRRVIGVDNDNKAADDSQLIARARSDRAAFVQLYRSHYDAVFRYCVHRLFERQAAEDVTSDVFLKVVENIHKLLKIFTVSKAMKSSFATGFIESQPMLLIIM